MMLWAMILGAFFYIDKGLRLCTKETHQWLFRIVFFVVVVHLLDLLLDGLSLRSHCDNI
jgi:hypothetical protein